MESGDTMTSNTDTKPTIQTSLGGTVENVPEDVVWIDNAFMSKRRGLVFM